MTTRTSLLIAAAVAIALPTAGCKPDPVKPKVSEPKAGAADSMTRPAIPPAPPGSSPKQ